MADETASLIIAVDSTSATAAVGNLDALTAAGGRAQASTGNLADAVKRQNAAMALGNTELERATQVLGRGAVATSAMGKEAEKAAVAIGKVGISSSLATREILVLGREAARGNWTRMAGSATILAQALGFTFTSAILGAAAGIGIFGFALVKGSREADALNRELINTGGIAGVTRGQINQMAESMANSGTSIGAARDALSQIAATGRFTGEALERAGKAALNMSILTGESMAKAVAAIVALADEPTRASEKLDKSMHYLTTSTLQQIDTLERLGQRQEAGDLAEETYASNAMKRVDEYRSHLSLLGQAIESIGNSASFMWDKLKGLMQASTDQERLGNLQEQLVRMSQSGDGRTRFNTTAGHVGWEAVGGKPGDYAHSILSSFSGMQPRVTAENQAAATKAATDQIQAAGNIGVQTLDRLGISTDGLTRKQEKLKQAAQALYEVYRAGGKLPAGVSFGGAIADQPSGPGWEAIQKQIEGKGKSGHARTPVDKEANAYNSINKSIQEHIALLREAADGTGKLDENQKFAAKILEDLDLKTNKLNARDKERIRLSVQQLLADDKLAESNKRTIKLKEEEARADDAVLKYQARLAEHMASELNAIIYTNVARKKEQDLLKVTLYYEEMRDSVMLRFAGDSKEATAARLEELAKLTAAEKVSAESVVAGYAAQAQARGSWQVGAANALTRFEEDAGNVAGMVESGMTNAFQGAQDALLNFVNTGKLNFKDFAKSIIIDIEKIIIKMMVLKAVEAIVGGISNSASAQIAPAGGWDGSANGNAFSAGSLIPFARGGIFDSPTAFGMSGGRMGVMGEAGPEAVMPLSRGSDGKLGVKASGGATVGDINITVVVDNGGNARSKSTGADQAQARAFAQLIETKVQEGITTARRQGGQLWAMANGR